jgi:hypothetical protein
VKPRNTLILVAVFAILAGYLYFVELNKTPEQISAALGTPSPRPTQYIFQLDSNNIQRMEVTDLQSPLRTNFLRTDQGWKLTAPIEKMADQNKAVPLSSSMATLQATRVLTNVTNLAGFGLVTGTIEARMVMTDSTAYGITVGNKIPDGNGYYAAYTGDKSKVFIIDTSLVESLKSVLSNPPIEPPPTPTPTATPPVTPTLEATATLSPTLPLPNIVPTFAPPVATPKP